MQLSGVGVEMIIYFTDTFKDFNIRHVEREMQSFPGNVL